VGDFYTIEELLDIGFEKIGNNVNISKHCRFYSVSGTIGDGTRIDDFSILKGNFEIGRKVHICSHSSLSAVGGTIKIGDLCGIGVNNIFYTASDDMLKSALCGPLVDPDHLAHKKGDIIIGKGVALGGRNTIFPGTRIGDFSAFGISAVLSGNYDEYSLYMNINGILKKISTRDRRIILDMAEKELG
tara:strand:+ start:1809 stop:2369 length:561 start_codon:yes stop_codon:yes gene_type:complete